MWGRELSWWRMTPFLLTQVLVQSCFQTTKLIAVEIRGGFLLIAKEFIIDNSFNIPSYIQHFDDTVIELNRSNEFLVVTNIGVKTKEDYEQCSYNQEEKDAHIRTQIDLCIYVFESVSVYTKNLHLWPRIFLYANLLVALGLKYGTSCENRNHRSWSANLAC